MYGVTINIAVKTEHVSGSTHQVSIEIGSTRKAFTIS